MTMEEKNQAVTNYINSAVKYFEEVGYPISDETIKNVMNRYIDSDKSFDEIEQELDNMVKEKIETIRSRIEQLSNQNKEIKITDLNVENTGITLNEQDVDLLMIANANNLNELKAALNKITNIKYNLPSREVSNEEFASIRQQVFDLYKESLTRREVFFKDRKIQLKKKIEYLINSGILNEEELQTLDLCLQSNNKNQILNNLNEKFSKEKVHQILQTIKDYSPIEKVGIIDTDMETFQKMYQEINSGKYNSITIDEGKYSNIVLQDGTCDFTHFQKVLDFAKANEKKVRLNTLLFYMDCPDSLYNLDVNKENKEKVKQALADYVKQTTEFIRDNGYEDTIRSIDVFNELLNRFAIDGDTPYMYRGAIEQNPNVEDFDNIKSGWLKFLDVEDLCDVIAIARDNLPSTDFMFNDDHLIDPRKIDANTEIIRRIKNYEQEHGVKLIDSIGTQMHIDNSVTKEQIITMFKKLSEYGLPIEITEFDMAMICNVDGLSETEINNLRVQKMNENFEAIKECKETHNINIRGFTIWSITDAQNCRVSLANEERIRNGLEPIKSLQGGYYNNDMSEKKFKLEKQDITDTTKKTENIIRNIEEKNDSLKSMLEESKQKPIAESIEKPKIENKEKHKTFKKINNNQSNNNASNGFADAIGLTVIICLSLVALLASIYILINQ